jgi:hypothetical protein
MKHLRDIVEERKVDPVELAQKVAKRYGKKTRYGKWFKAERGEHIPLKSFNARQANSVETKGNNIWHKMGGEEKFAEAHKSKIMQIKDLKATQPFVRINDTEKLKNKISVTNPNHITVATHKGEHYIMDGHHAVMAAMLRGEKHVAVQHLNYDNY